MRFILGLVSAQLVAAALTFMCGVSAGQLALTVRCMEVFSAFGIAPNFALIMLAIVMLGHVLPLAAWVFAVKRGRDLGAVLKLQLACSVGEVLAALVVLSVLTAQTVQMTQGVWCDAGEIGRAQRDRSVKKVVDPKRYQMPPAVGEREHPLSSFKDEHNLCIVESGEGKVYCLGSNDNGERGVGAFGETAAKELEPVVELSGATRVEVGQSGACALRSDRTVWCWGGIGRPAAHRRRGEPGFPKPVKVADDVDEISMGLHHLCVLSGGKVSCRGENERGQLARPGGDDQHSLEFLPVELPEAAGSLASGYAHTCALLASGRPYCWGEWTSREASAPSEVVVPRLRSLYASAKYTCGILRDGGQVTCWGKLPTGLAPPGRDRSEAVVPKVSEVKELALGLDTACALLPSDELWCWGEERFEAYSYVGLGDETAERALSGVVHRVASGVSSVVLSETWPARVGKTAAHAAPGRSRSGSLRTTHSRRTELSALAHGLVHRRTTQGSCFGPRTPALVGVGALSDGLSEVLP